MTQPGSGYIPVDNHRIRPGDAYGEEPACPGGTNTRLAAHRHERRGNDSISNRATHLSNHSCRVGDDGAWAGYS